MPTVGIYVPMGVTRKLAKRWEIDADDPHLDEVVRMLCAEALEDAAGLGSVGVPFNPLCVNAEIHRIGHRCRRCGGGR